MGLFTAVGAARSRALLSEPDSEAVLESSLEGSPAGASRTGNGESD